MLGRPVKFAADRYESFLSDIHARDHRVKAKLAVDREGNMTALEIDDLTGIGPYSMFPRSSGVECNQVLNLTGGPYKHPQYRAKGTVVFQNKNMMCQYRAVGHPIAVAVAEHMVDQAAAKLGIDPAEMRKRNLIADDAYPCKSASGMRFEALSHHECLDKLLALMKYDELRKEQAELRKKGVVRGIGLSSFIEVTNPSPMFYGVGGARIAAQDGCTIRSDAYPCKSASGMRFEALSHHECLDKLLALMKYDELRKEQAELRKKGVVRGIGLSSFIEVTNPSPMFYGVGGARIAAQDGCTI